MIALQPMWMPVGPSLMQVMGWNGSAVATAASGLRSDRNKAPRGGAPPANWWSNAQRGAYVEGSEPAMQDGGSAGEGAADGAAVGARVGSDGKDKNNPK